MPALREQGPDHIGEASTSKTIRRSVKSRLNSRRSTEKAPNSAPGIQKIKGALRQTRRLLAKDKLAADLRIETERRLRALEADLHAAEVAKKERTLATRYHKIKFFERQKVTRKIKQIQDRLKVEQKKSKKKKLTSELQELRIDLNYIFHYPKLKKYISLFPPEVRNGSDAVSQSEAQNTNSEREEIRIWIRDRMKNGELPSEPELTLGSHRVNEPTQSASWPRDGPVVGTTSFEQKGTAEDGIEDDEFFGEDDEAEDS